MTDKWSQQGEHYSPTKCEFCNCYMPRQVEYDEDYDIVGFITKCTPCTQRDKIMDSLLNYRV